jgi:hypothetical protein
MDQKESYAAALATAFASDINQPSMAAAIKDGGLTQGQFTSIVYRDVRRGLDSAPGPALFPAVRAFVRQAVQIDAALRRREAGLSADVSADVSMVGGISSVIGALAGAVGAIWATKINTDAQKKLASIQVNEAQIQQNSQAIAAKSALINNATANGLLVAPSGSVVDPAAGVVTAGPLAAVGGLPGIALATAAMAALYGAYTYAKG